MHSDLDKIVSSHKSQKHPAAFNIIIKPRGPICNLACDYCYFLKTDALYPASQFRMGEQLLETFTKQYIASQRIPQVSFSWQGGEPTLMGLDFFKKAIKFQKKYLRSGIRIDNALQTNGTLLTDEWCAYLKENNFLIGISIDGPEELHNVYRKNKEGRPVFEQVLNGLSNLKKHEVDYNILATVNVANVEFPLEVYQYFRDVLEAEFIQFIPIVERKQIKENQKGNLLAERSISGKQYGKFLISIFDEWVKRDIGKVFVQIFDVALGKWLGAKGGLCIFNETCGLGLALEHNGDLYSCDHFVEPKHKLGNIALTELISLVGSQKQRKFGLDKKITLPKCCKECEVLFACNGGCPKNRIINTFDGENKINHLCEGYRQFFMHIDIPMRMMAKLIKKRRPPSEIMKSYEG